MDKCENCRFYDAKFYTAAVYGRCVRFPPLDKSDASEIEVRDDHYCGEFQPKEAEPVETHWPGRAEAEKLKKRQESTNEGNPVLHIDMNVMVSVELTEHGLSVLKKYYTDIRCDIQENFGKDNLYKRTLCYLFHIFGPNCYNGAENVFVDNKITIQP